MSKHGHPKRTSQKEKQLLCGHVVGKMRYEKELMPFLLPTGHVLEVGRRAKKKKKRHAPPQRESIKISHNHGACPLKSLLKKNNFPGLLKNTCPMACSFVTMDPDSSIP